MERRTNRRLRIDVDEVDDRVHAFSGYMEYEEKGRGIDRLIFRVSISSRYQVLSLRLLSPFLSDLGMLPIAFHGALLDTYILFIGARSCEAYCDAQA